MQFIYFDVANTLLGKPDVFNNIQNVLSAEGITIERTQLVRAHKICSELIKFPDKTNKDFYYLFNSELLYSLGIIPSKSLLDKIFSACTYLPWKPFEDTSYLNEITIKKGILSNWDKSLETKLNNYFNCGFDIILGSEKEGMCKPNTSFFNKAIKQVSSFDYDEILFVGDSIKLDIEPAIELGIRAILIDRNNTYPHFSGEKIKNLHELKDFIE